MNTYEQKYKSALEWMRSIYPTMQGVDKEDAEHYFPELKESEDERIRKGIICGMNALKEQHKETFASIPINDCIAWLEKQDEKKHIKKQDYSGLNDFERAIHRGFLCAGMENVPVTIIKETAKDCINEIKSLEIGCKQKPVEQDTEIHDLWEYIREWNDKFGRLLKDEDELASCIDYVIKRQKAAWSEEDRKHIDNIISLLNQAKERFVRESGQFPSWITEILWLESIKDRIQPQQEWSEYDKIQLSEAIQMIEANGTWIRSEDAVKKVSNWLKSLKDRFQLQPKQEWSEEDEEMYKEVLTDIIYAKNDLKTKGCLELSNRAMKAFNWFSKRHKSLRPQSKWKPSEEQMKGM